ncbi:unnamed protein product [Rotaria magnacalcarata]|uniref:Uncharacterized protein n=1 Tax=Rotaria magnacalcarata TaxID=392030 RepID=A0A815UGC6_9BILA|nr:unnamed protein product [Rotaria magnacalcarata]CAF4773465.1 unnamed protein product [Rotaria magnacalcarata]
MSKRPTGSHFTSSKTSIFFTSRSKPNSPCPPPHNHTTCPPPQNHSTCPPRRNHSPRPLPDFFSQEVEDDLSIDNDRLFSQQVQKKNIYRYQLV